MTEEIDDLLDKWDEAFIRGEDLSLDQLCPDASTELRQKFARRQKGLHQVNQLMDLTSNPVYDNQLTSGRFGFESGNPVPVHGLDDELMELIGRGGFGEVWKVVNPFTNAVSAIKFCDPALRSSLLREAKLFARITDQLDSKTFVNVKDTYLKSAEPPCIRLEFVEWPTLEQILTDRESESDSLNPYEATRLIHRLAKVMGQSHSLNPAVVHPI